MEAEGHFGLIFNKKGQLRSSRFIIGQNDDYSILELIKYHLKSSNSILKDKNKNHYRLNVYNKNSRLILFRHFHDYPLLGFKKIAWLKFYNYHCNKGC